MGMGGEEYQHLQYSLSTAYVIIIEDINCGRAVIIVINEVTLSEITTCNTTSWKHRESSWKHRETSWKHRESSWKHRESS